MTRWPVLLIGALLLCACTAPRNTLRLVSRPDGAAVTLPERGNLKLNTPAELPGDLDPRDRIIVVKDGYVPYDGPLGDLPRISAGTYECVLTLRGD